MKTKTFNRPLTIEAIVVSPTENDFGEIDYESDASWTTVWSGFCAVESRGGREFFRVSRIEVNLAWLLSVRWTPTLEAITSQDHRLKFQGRVFQIGYIGNLDDGNRLIELGATERVEVA